MTGVLVLLNVEAQGDGDARSLTLFCHQFDARMRRYGQTSRRCCHVCTTTTTKAFRFVSCFVGDLFCRNPQRVPWMIMAYVLEPP